MAEDRWFDDFTRALAGGGGRRDFLRLLLGGLAGAVVGGVVAREGEAAPAAQAVCSPRPRVVVTNAPASDRLNVTVGATGSGNSLRKITFGVIRNGVVDVPGVVTGAGSNYFYSPPPGATQTSFGVRAVDTNAVVQVPFTVNDVCGDWKTFVGTGAGALKNPAIVCSSGETTLTAAASIGATALQVSNQGCFKGGERIGLDPGGPNEEFLEVIGFGSVLTKTPTQKAHPAGTRAKRYPSLDPDFCVTDADCAGQGGTCCKAGASTGRCCTSGQCCPDGCCTGIYTQCCGGANDGVCIESPNPADCCAQGHHCPTGAAAGSECCDFQDGTGFKCHPPSDFQSSVGNCSSCGNDCRSALIGGDRCVSSVCKCGSGPACFPGECLRGTCCNPPNKVCGPSSNRQCCNADVAYCSPAPGGSSICCNKNRSACGSTCCSVGSYCVGGACRTCGCGGNNTDGQNNTCLCGSGPTCSASQGQECRSGACTCAASQPGWKLAFFSCDFDPSINAYNRVVWECDPSQTICKKTDPSLPAELPPYSCSSGSCNPGYTPMSPLCVGS